MDVRSQKCNRLTLILEEFKISANISELTVDDCWSCDVDCFYGGGDGRCWPEGAHWPGRQAGKEGDRIGMELNVDERTMTLYKNGLRLGVMKTDLKGPEFCWAIAICNQGECVRIRSVPDFAT